jgi:acetyl-CoA carboxylase biotin carboxyl carrier protein
VRRARDEVRRRQRNDYQRDGSGDELSGTPCGRRASGRVGQPAPARAQPSEQAARPPDHDGHDAATAAAAALKEIKSPMVGTYYKSPEPGADPYVKVGSRVAPGQTVCIIEAMKIMNEIEAEFGGVIREVLADDAQPVEFGQVLFRVDPHG